MPSFSRNLRSLCVVVVVVVLLATIVLSSDAFSPTRSHRVGRLHQKQQQPQPQLTSTRTLSSQSQSSSALFIMPEAVEVVASSASSTVSSTFFPLAAAAGTMDPTTVLSDLLRGLLGSPAILLVPIVAALGVASLIAFFIVSYANPEVEDDEK